MKSRYKIIISNKNLYKEIELSPDVDCAKIGTEIDCDFRLHRDLFFESVSIILSRKDDKWFIICSDNLYISTGDVRKLITKELKHGDNISIKYQSSNSVLFNLEFDIDFNDGNIRYERAFDISNCSKITIGTEFSSDIVIRSRYTNSDNIVLTKKDTAFLLNIKNTFNGVYHNGKLATNGEIIKNGDFLSISDSFFYLKDNKLWTEKGTLVSSSSIKYEDNPEINIYPKFERSTRSQTTINEDKIEILDPPAKHEKTKDNLLMRLLPSVGMLAGAGVMAAYGGVTMIVISGISASMAIVTAFLGIRQNKKEYKLAEKNRIEQYNRYIDEKKNEIKNRRKNELSNLEEIYISYEKEEENFKEFSPRLFDRNVDDSDFLCVRLGTGEVEAKQVINYKKQEKLEVEDDLQKLPQKICEEYKNIKNAPVYCDFKTASGIGVVGNSTDTFDIFKVIVLDLIARHHYQDLGMIFVAENSNKEKVRWLRLLPYVYNDDIAIPNIISDDESRNVVFEYLYKELTFREQSKDKGKHIVIFMVDEYGFNKHPISKFLKQAKELNVTFVFFNESQDKISGGCSYIIKVDNNTGSLIDVKDKNNKKEFNFDTITNENAKKIVDFLSPIFTEDVSLESSLTKNISIFDLLHIISVEDIDLYKRWSSSKVFKSMSAPIGVSKTGVVSLDLHDKAHGPHGLVAGTTGSGKSEILQTYILSMITLFHPYEVGFVIIDFKGGGMVNQFKNVPHLLGAITNIDGKAINRSLKSIKAELQKRQKYFAEADVNHIDKYIKKYKNGEVENPLPHLIIIVDEFAELKAEQPEFMKELISAARIGRSLGVHLILATQKPAGQVNEQIWSNSRFKLCLKVQSQEDSNEVLKSPLAAEIKEPGRAYLQVGNNEIFELFQSAYSGASDKPDESSVKEFQIYSILETGKKVKIFEQKKTKTDEDSTQLTAIVDYVHDYCAKNNIEKLPDICLPVLEEYIPFIDIKTEDNINTVVNIGVYDDPNNQYQGNYSINLSEQNVLIIGSAQSGKTNVLQTIIRDLSSKYTPDEVNIYIMDFASMVLKNFENLNHVGGVVTSSEDEKLKNLLKLLFGEIEARKEILLSVGVSSFTAYREAGYTDLPQIVLLIDNLTALKELYFQDDDSLLTLCREGISVGLSIIIANSQTTGIGYRYLSNFNCKIAMFCNDSSEYHSLFEHCNERIDDIHGRSIVEVDRSHYECQMYLPFQGEKEFERVGEIKKFIATINKKYKGSKAKIIPLIPEILTADYINNNFAKEMIDNDRIVLGLDYSTVSPFALDMTHLGLVAVSGKENSGKHNFIKYIIDSFEYNHSDGSEVYIIDGIARKLSSHKDKPNVVAYEMLPDRAFEFITEIESKLAERYSAVATGNENVLDEEKTIILIINSLDVVEALCANQQVYSLFTNIIGKYKNMKISVILGDFENKTVNYNSPELYRQIRDSRHLFFFGDINSLKVFDLPLSMIREYKKPVSVGDCYYINDNMCLKLKTPLNK